MARRMLLLAGEESGVIYARRLAERLEAAGVELRGYHDYGFSTADLAVFGFWSVLRRIFYFLRVARTMKRAIREWMPSAVVTVDYPGLNLKLAAYAKGRGIPAIHVVCPQVWAWHRGRIPKVAASLTELLCFFPFEPGLFDGTGLDAKFIGHPLVRMVEDESAGGGSGAVRATATTNPDPPAKTVALLPGSRIVEIERVLPRLLRAVEVLVRGGRVKGPLRIAIPAANAMAEREIRRIISGFSVLPPICVQSGNARQVLRTADCAAVASGTATLEAALVRCPTVLVYAVSPFLAWFARRVITGVRHVGLVNVVAEKCGFDPPMPELLQEAFTPEAVASQLADWLTDETARLAAKDRLDRALEHLRAEGEPLDLAAREILSRAAD